LTLKALNVENRNQKNPLPDNQSRRLKLVLPENIDIKFSASAHQISYKKALINDLNLRYSQKRDMAELNELTFSFASGRADLHGFMANNRQETSPGYLYARIENMDIQQFLASFDSFNQDAFTSRNSSGTISMNSHFYFGLRPDFTPTLDDNVWMFDFTIHNAELNEVEPIQKTLFFVGHKAKDNIIISEMNARAIMFRDKLYLSGLRMNDNIANLEIFGQYTHADASLDLGTKISLSDLFFRSKKERIVETQEGKFTLDEDSQILLRMTGLLSDHKLSLSSKRKMASFERELSREIRKASKEFQKKEKERKENNL